GRDVVVRCGAVARTRPGRRGRWPRRSPPDAPRGVRLVVGRLVVLAARHFLQPVGGDLLAGASPCVDSERYTDVDHDDDGKEGEGEAETVGYPFGEGVGVGWGWPHATPPSTVMTTRPTVTSSSSSHSQPMRLLPMTFSTTSASCWPPTSMTVFPCGRNAWRMRARAFSAASVVVCCVVVTVCIASLFL